MFHRLARNPHTPEYHGREFGDVMCHEDRLEEPLGWKKPRMIFVNSMSDLGHPRIPREFLDKNFAVMATCRQHTFQILTKRPERILDYLSDERIEERWFDAMPGCDAWEKRDRQDRMSRGWPLPNVWLGVSVEDQKTADERIPSLLQVPAAVRFVSYEPALGPVDFRISAFNGADSFSGMEGIDWIICGGESGPGARPMHPDWARSVRDQCKAAGVAFFFKQWGEWAPNCLCPTKDAHDAIKRPEPGHPGVMFRCGKKRAGRLLDGVEHSEYPEVRL